MQELTTQSDEQTLEKLKNVETEKDSSGLMNDSAEVSDETNILEAGEVYESPEENYEDSDNSAAQLDDKATESLTPDDTYEVLKQLIRSEIKEEFDNQFAVLADQLESQFHTLSSKADSIIDKDGQLQEKDELFQKVYTDLKKYQSGKTFTVFPMKMQL